MADLFICKEAEDEIEALYDVDEDVAALIDTLLFELSEDQSTLEWLFRPQDHYNYKPPFEVKEFIEAKRRGKYILILKIRREDEGPIEYRVLMGYNAQQDTYWVLTVADREISYDTSDPLFQSLLVRYEQCGLHTYV